MTTELTDHDKATIAALLSETITAYHFPLLPRVRRLQAILDKLYPPRVVEVMPPPKTPGEPSFALRKKRRP